MNREFGFKTERVTTNKRTGLVTGVTVSEFDLIKGDRYKFARVDSGTLMNVIMPIKSLGLTPVEHSRTISLLDYLQPNSNELWLVTRNKKHPLTIKGMEKAMSVEEDVLVPNRAVKQLVSKLLDLGFLGTVTTVLDIKGDKEIIGQAYCVNPIYAIRGAWVSLVIYRRFKKFMDPYLSKNQLLQFKEMEARAAVEEGKDDDVFLTECNGHMVDLATGEIVDSAEDEAEAFETLYEEITGGNIQEGTIKDPAILADSWTFCFGAEDEEEEAKRIITGEITSISQKHPDIRLVTTDNLTYIDAARIVFVAKALLGNDQVTAKEKAASVKAARSLIAFI